MRRLVEFLDANATNDINSTDEAAATVAQMVLGGDKDHHDEL